jgi:hypothetical protein
MQHMIIYTKLLTYHLCGNRARCLWDTETERKAENENSLVRRHCELNTYLSRLCMRQSFVVFGGSVYVLLYLEKHVKIKLE